MKKLLTIGSGLLALALAPALALALTLWSPTTGDINIPGLTASTIDNMAIGSTTPAAGSFTTMTAPDSICANFSLVNGLTLTGATDSAFFIAPRAMLVTSIREIHAVAAGGASLLQVTKDTGTTAPGAGTDLLTNNTNTGFDLNATANTLQTGTLVVAATRTLAAGDRLSVDFSGAIQSSANVLVTACMQQQ